MRDMVHVHVTADLPIRARALPFADRVEIRLGNAFPAVLLIERLALDRLEQAFRTGREELEAAGNRQTERGTSS